MASIRLVSPVPRTLDHIVVKAKRFQCLRCQRLFARLEHLQRHERTHTQERPFACNQCESRFTRSDLLIRHERLSHGANKEGLAEPRSSSSQQIGPGPSDITPPPPPPPLFSPEVVTRPANDMASSSPSASVSAGTDSPVSSHISPVEASASSFIGLVQDFLSRGPVSYEQGEEEYSFLDAQAESPAHMYPGAGSTFTDSLAGGAVQGGNSLSPSAHREHRLSPIHPIHADLDESCDGFSAFLENGNLSTYNFTPASVSEQNVPLFIFEPFILPTEGDDTPGALNSRDRSSLCTDEVASFSRFGSRLPSLQPEDNASIHSRQTPGHPFGQHHEVPRQPVPPRRAFDISSEDRTYMVHTITSFTTVPNYFQLPTRLSLSRYIRAYIEGFHEHLPFLHIPSLSVQACSVELILAMAAVGAQYCFEGEKGVELFHAAQAVATERIRRQDVRMAQPAHKRLRQASHSSFSTASSFLGNLADLQVDQQPEPPNQDTMQHSSTEEDLMQSAQALLILMAMATWAKHKEIMREALAIQSILASVVRDDGLTTIATQDSAETSETWEAWVKQESVLRTKYIVFCFFNLHCIVYDIPPLILNSELKMRLPCSAVEFKADSASRWQEARSARPASPAQFQDALHWLFSSSGHSVPQTQSPSSSLGNYILIHAIIQHIFLVRQTATCRFNTATSSSLPTTDVAPLEQALRKWQLGWESSPESSLDPTDQTNGPVAFNSTALLRLAYIRLNMDTGPGRALSTRDPLQIAHALRDTPTVTRTPKLVRALLHATHALSIPVKIGIRLVAKTQTFIWSIQHSLCSLECALLLSKWLETISVHCPERGDEPVTDAERRILGIVKTMVDETEFAIPPEVLLDLQGTARHLNIGVLRVWATIFKGAQTWAIVDVVGSSLNMYADMLEAGGG
ncbi:zinc finger protein ADR1 [Podospora didyma]|uniref:Zinc finger protein ADR1 n=1 Tax=Podospora didyma TaxID=330526 RepID=A0AAE0NUM2_9PEZI|nr:zinc finger protein ADR1 [Podospora didyma]